MIILFIEDGIEIANFNVESIPFKIGDKIEIKITNNNKEIWNVDDLDSQYVVQDIKNIWSIRYPYDSRVNGVKKECIIEVYVRSIKEDKVGNSISNKCEECSTVLGSGTVFCSPNCRMHYYN